MPRSRMCVSHIDVCENQVHNKQMGEDCVWVCPYRAKEDECVCVCINSMCAERYLLGDAGSKVGEDV